jgi:hypothetical protein
LCSAGTGSPKKNAPGRSANVAAVLMSNICESPCPDWHADDTYQKGRNDSNNKTLKVLKYVNCQRLQATIPVARRPVYQL